jgi:uncharacterized protein YodC (DUF2158 family)
MKIGDVVVLKSGSSVMTVVDVPNTKQATCSWFADGEVRSAMFPIAALQDAPEDDENDEDDDEDED